MHEGPAMSNTHIAILTFDGFNELDSLIALALLNRAQQPGWRVTLCCPTPSVTSMNGALAIHRLRRRIGTDQRIEVARLELVRVARQHLEVADAVVARAGLERRRGTSARRASCSRRRCRRG